MKRDAYEFITGTPNPEADPVGKMAGKWFAWFECLWFCLRIARTTRLSPKWTGVFSQTFNNRAAARVSFCSALLLANVKPLRKESL
jgi:hypothetical protein